MVPDPADGALTREDYERLRVAGAAMVTPGLEALNKVHGHKVRHRQALPDGRTIVTTDRAAYVVTPDAPRKRGRRT